jgi:hypothetical protein
MRQSSLRVISSIVLCFFTWTFGGLFEIAAAAQQDTLVQSKKEAQARAKAGEIAPGGNFHKVVDDIENIPDDKTADVGTNKSG